VTDEPDIATELGPGERELADRLDGERPLPAAGFRGALARRLAARDPGYGPRPERLRLIVGAYLGAGSLLIVLGALSATGVL
jgi:hypothetical protein